MLKFSVHLIGGEHDEVATVTCERRDGRFHLAFRYRSRTLEENSTDFFEALCQVRLRLEAEKLMPFCYGASLNVFPSGMCRDMGAGLQAYRMVIGRHVNPDDDRVGIFDQGPDVIPATVARQKEHFEEWAKTRKV